MQALLVYQVPNTVEDYIGLLRLIYSSNILLLSGTDVIVMLGLWG